MKKKIQIKETNKMREGEEEVHGEKLTRQAMKKGHKKGNETRKERSGGRRSKDRTRKE